MLEQKNGLIYKAINIINGKSYIGQTWNFKKRKKDHIRDGESDKQKNFNRSLLTKAIRKYGKENFTWEIIDWAEDQKSLDKLEAEHIIKNNSLDRRYGYNLKEGGANGKFSEEAKINLSRGLGGKPFWAKKGDNLKYFQTTVEAAKELGIQDNHISYVLHGKLNHMKYWFFSHDDLTNWVDPRRFFARKENSDEILEFFSYKDAERELGFATYSCIVLVLNGEMETTQGYRFSRNRDELVNYVFPEKKYFYAAPLDDRSKIYKFAMKKEAAKILKINATSVTRAFKHKRPVVCGYVFGNSEEEVVNYIDNGIVKRKIEYTKELRIKMSRSQGGNNFWAKKGDDLRYFNLVSDASKELNMPEGNIHHVLNGQHNFSNYWWFSYDDLTDFVDPNRFFARKGDKIWEFFSLTEAAKTLGIHYEGIQRVLDGKFKNSFGYFFSYDRNFPQVEYFYGYAINNSSEIYKFETMDEARVKFGIKFKKIGEILRGNVLSGKGYSFRNTLEECSQGLVENNLSLKYFGPLES